MRGDKKNATAVRLSERAMERRPQTLAEGIGLDRHFERLITRHRAMKMIEGHR